MREYLLSDDFQQNLVDAIVDYAPDEDEFDMLYHWQTAKNEIIENAAETAETIDGVPAEDVMAALNADEKLCKHVFELAMVEARYELEDDWDEEDEE